MDCVTSMNVIKRNGFVEELLFDKILNRIRNLGLEVNIHINYQSLVIKVIDQLYNNIHTSKIDELVAEQCAVMATNHPDYAILAARIVISNHQKNTDSLFSTVANNLHKFVDIHNNPYPLVSDTLIEFCNFYRKEIDDTIVDDRDYFIDYFGFKTLEKSYLLKINNKTVERPQHMWMRVAIGIHGNMSDANSLALVKETYDLVSQKYFTHSTPTLFNSGTMRPQLSSCYLIGMESDSIEGIFNTIKDTALISKVSGGIGLHIHNIRSKKSHIRGTNGQTDGIVPMLKVVNNVARYVNQCFSPETWVYSHNGPIQMKNVTVRDKLITVDGSFKKVNEVIVNHIDKEILEIKVEYSMYPVKVTKNHELFVIKSYNANLNFNTFLSKIKNKLIKPEYLSADKAKENDFMGFPIPTYELDNNMADLLFYKFYGIFVSNSYVCKNKNKCGIKLNCVHSHVIEFVTQFLKSNHIAYSENKRNNHLYIRWSNRNNNKSISVKKWRTSREAMLPNDFLHLPKCKIVKMVEGLLLPFTDVPNFSSTSQLLVLQLRYLLLRLGVLTFGIVDENNNKTTHILQLDTNQKFSIISGATNMFHTNYFEWNCMLWCKISSIKNTKYTGDVYDFNMIDNHNYMTDMGLVHNSGKRNGSFAIYLETWHSDIEDFLEMRKNHGDEEMRARDLFYALWISDLFMERVKQNGDWSLMCPNQCPGLSDVYGDAFVTLYEKYETDGNVKKTIKARDLWIKILDSQMETGNPYLVYKDASNAKSNQKNLGTIKSSNLCTEIMQYSDSNETAVCNLASIALPTFVDSVTKQFNYEKLHEVTKVITNNLNKIIDINYYPTQKTKHSNLKHRPIGIGVQGLADTFILLDMPFHSNDAKEVNKLIFETIYHASLEKSNEIALDRMKYMRTLTKTQLLEYINEYEYDMMRKIGAESDLMGAYSSFQGSPTSSGILQFDLWSATPSTRYDWDLLKNSIKQYGIRNSLLLAAMPTASTSQILGFNECFEPLTSNLYSRRTLAGEFVVVNKYLMRELLELGCWNEQTKNSIILNKGSIQQLTFLSEHIRNKYKIVWEIPMKHVIDMSADRGVFICQSQSLNLWMEDPTHNSLTSMHFYAWQKGLKTGIYYLRRKAKHQAQQFTIEPSQQSASESSHQNDDICEMCSA